MCTSEIYEIQLNLLNYDKSWKPVTVTDTSLAEKMDFNFVHSFVKHYS